MVGLSNNVSLLCCVTSCLSYKTLQSVRTSFSFLLAAQPQTLGLHVRSCSQAALGAAKPHTFGLHESSRRQAAVLAAKSHNFGLHVSCPDKPGCGAMRFGSTGKVLAKCMLKYYRITECCGRWTKSSIDTACCHMRFGSTAKVMAKCKLKYYRISECAG